MEFSAFLAYLFSTAEAYSRLKRPLQQSEDAKLGSLLSDSDWQAVAGWSMGSPGTLDPTISRNRCSQCIRCWAKSRNLWFGLVLTTALCREVGSALYGLYSSGQRAQAALDSLKSQYPELPFETFALWD